MAQTQERPRTVGLVPGVPVAIALTTMLAAQSVLSLASLTVPVIATLVAADTGFSVALIGYYGAIIMLGATVAAILGALVVSKLGPIRSSQLMLIAAAAGLLLHPLASYAGFVIGAFLIGCGYGPANSAGSSLLRRVVPLHRRSLVFSIKQTSIPLGGAVAGILVPFLAGDEQAQICGDGGPYPPGRPAEPGGGGRVEELAHRPVIPAERSESWDPTLRAFLRSHGSRLSRFALGRDDNDDCARSRFACARKVTRQSPARVTQSQKA